MAVGEWCHGLGLLWGLIQGEKAFQTVPALYAHLETPQEPTSKLLWRVWLAALGWIRDLNIRGDGIGSGCIGMTLAFELSAVGRGLRPQRGTSSFSLH